MTGRQATSDRGSEPHVVALGRPIVGRPPTIYLGVTVFFVLASIPRAAIAEVSDKCLSIQDHWVIALPMAVILLLVARWRWWMTFPLGLLTAILVFAEMELPNDSYFGSALLQEQGWAYFVSMWASEMHLVAALVGGGYLGWQRRSRMETSSPGPSLGST
jgi:hypothetical protein